MAKASKKSRPVKECRINFRISEEKQDFWRKLAERKQQTLTEFIDESVSIVAECELANEKHFSLPPAQWNAFIEALDRPAHIHPGLRRLLSEPSALELAHDAKK